MLNGKGHIINMEMILPSACLTSVSDSPLSLKTQKLQTWRSRAGMYMWHVEEQTPILVDNLVVRRWVSRTECSMQGVYDSLTGMTHLSPLVSIAWLEEVLLPTSVWVIFTEWVIGRISHKWLLCLNPVCLLCDFLFSWSFHNESVYFVRIIYLLDQLVIY